MQEYSIILPNQKQRTYRLITSFVFLLNLGAFAFIYVNAATGTFKNIALISGILSAVFLFLPTLNIYTKNFSVHFAIAFILLGISWMLLGKFFIGACILLFAVAGFYTNSKLRIRFTSQKIIYPSFPEKIILWTEVNNVMLKDDILTVDMKNNKLIQSVIEKESSPVSEASFNEFCRKHISSDVIKEFR